MTEDKILLYKITLRSVISHLIGLIICFFIARIMKLSPDQVGHIKIPLNKQVELIKFYI